VRDVINNQGQILNHIRYDSFGKITAQTNANVDFRFGYTGREFDEETGLYYYRARYYDAATGRFISEDPMGFGAGDSNLYRYVGNSATNYTDPTGNFAFNLGGLSAALTSINWDRVALSSLGSLAAVTIAPDAVQAPKSACDIKPGDNALTRAGIEILGSLGLSIFSSLFKVALGSFLDDLFKPGVLRNLARGGASSENFPTINERASTSIIKQLTENSCGAACGQTLLLEAGIDVSQSRLAIQAGMNHGIKGIGVRNLANGMNVVTGSKIWQGGSVEASDEMLKALNKQGSWAALLNPKAKLGHFVIVDGFDNAGNILIRDPRGLGYSLSTNNFLELWSNATGYGGAVFK
jgi:RHS repeat-associated protein